MVKGISQKTKKVRQGDRNSVKGPKRTNEEILRDRAEIARLHMEGLSQSEIADKIAGIRPYVLSIATVGNDLKAVRSEWLSASIDNYEKTSLIELARLDEEESEAWAAWKRSTQPKKRRKERTRTGTNDGKPFEEFLEETDTEERDGNPAFLQRLESIRQRRCAILGFPAQQRSNDINAAIDVMIREGYTIGLPPEPGGEG
ncbi:MAG: hypothetical protein ACEQSB_06825 [Undibacterium sp.]